MKKRILCLFLSLALLVTSFSILTACGEEEPAPVGPGTTCTHRDADDNGKCDLCQADFTDGKDVADCQHRDADDNGKCDKCQADFTDGKDVDDCQHVDANDDGKCDECEEPFEDGSDVEHECKVEEWQSNKNRHWGACVICGEETAKVAHEFTGEDINTCVTCGYTCEHTFATDIYDYDRYDHWLLASCGHDVKINAKGHVYGLTDYCVCGRRIDEPDHDGEHTFEDDWAMFDENDPLGWSDELYHWKAPTCGCTAQQIPYFEHYETEPHDFGDDKICDTCGYEKIDRYDIEAKYANYTWPVTEIVVCLNEHSNNEELSSELRRYLAGDLSLTGLAAPENVDTLVTARNAAALEKTKVTTKYEYWGTNDNHTDEEPARWGSTISRMVEFVQSNVPGAPDIYVNQIYDMVSAQLNGAFANTRTTKLGNGLNYFAFTDPDYVKYAERTGNEFGYMLEYMSELGFSTRKQYLIASDYFIDLVRAFFVVPLNINLLKGLGVESSYAGDRDGDGDSDTDDFYQMVMNGEWTYDVLADYSGAVWKNTSNVTGGSMDDINGFILTTTNGLYSSAILYTTSIKVFDRTLNEETGFYECIYPATNEELYLFCDTLAAMVSSTGVYVDAVSHLDIRDRFTSDKVLFGGIALLGSLEYDSYQNMKNNGGFGILPVPLYRRYKTLEDGTKIQEKYLTIIHNMGRIAAIAANTTEFVQCSAYLDYQSTHSTEVLNEYYEAKLQYDMASGGTDEAATKGNIEILNYIRQNVRSAFDKTYEDAVGYKIKSEGGGTNESWGSIIQGSNYKVTTMRDKYVSNAAARAAHLKEIVESYSKLPE